MNDPSPIAEHAPLPENSRQFEPHSPGSKTTVNHPRFVASLLVAAWSGLAAGYLEVATIVVRKTFFDANHLIGMSHHYVWMIPAIYLTLFVATAVFTGVAAKFGPDWIGWVAKRVLCAMVLLPIFSVTFSRIFILAWFVLTLGVAIRLVPMLERHRSRFNRYVKLSLPGGIAALLLLAAVPVIKQRADDARQAVRPIPAPGSPNVVLIVLDTVAAGHLGLHGYPRPTSTSLEELAGSAIQFNHAQAGSSWTLPSHATMFTGRWLHELSVGWLNPLDDTWPTLAQYLQAHGYATAGFIGNTVYCARDSGLNRGFTHYEDYIFPQLTILKTASLVNRLLANIQPIVNLWEDQLQLAGAQSYVQRLWKPLVTDRKRASVVNRQFLAWLRTRSQPERPFFAFLNYFDAHTPYELPPGRPHRFRVARPDGRQNAMIRAWADLDQSRVSPADVATAVDAYDDCVADLDEQLGKLVDELRRRGELERTCLIITADHGESFGEHAAIFCHGNSLYQTELHVPLLILPPAAQASRKVVDTTVSLRDLPATVLDITRLHAGSPFPGASLARFWDSSSPAPVRSEPSLAEVVPADPHRRDAYGLPEKLWPMAALNDGEWTYIRGEPAAGEWLFHLRDDPKEKRNLATVPPVTPDLDRLRATMGQQTAGPLEPSRFNR